MGSQTPQGPPRFGPRPLFHAVLNASYAGKLGSPHFPPKGPWAYLDRTSTEALSKRTHKCQARARSATPVLPFVRNRPSRYLSAQS